MPAPALTKNDFEAKVLKAKTLVMIDFFAVWCGSCKMAVPVIDELAEEYKGKAVIFKVNVDEEQELAQKFGVMSIPTVILFKDGKEVDRQVGFPGKEGYIQMLDKHIQ
ncbi:thioredoxin [Candidatus Beckwithbacteria bacterium RBG_13_35_6]|uniref:Thioredoxin n=1 Tax=Candidatus Beckwithbacteria bacterium RBG_13_35_6 TaxID=1797456 RepID=A0A1F5DEH2_9BACT|nr:MAG: thioredoxin [Candidatus Beckwithbacteria bacterium RBG_13_35_6]